MDKRIEEIARECAEALVVVRAGVDAPESHRQAVFIGAEDAYHYRHEEDAQRDAVKFRGQIAHAVAAALRRLRDEMNALPVPSPVSGEMLAEIEATLDRYTDPSQDEWDLIGPARQLLAHVDHLERLVRLLAQESEGLAFEAGLAEGQRLGRAEGAKEQRAADVAAANECAAEIGEGYYGEMIVDAVRDAALVTDAEGAPDAAQG